MCTENRWTRKEGTLSHSWHWIRLYTAGTDGIIGIFEVKDRDPRAIKPDASFSGAGALSYSEEILTEKAKLEGLMQEYEQQENEYDAINPETDGNKEIEHTILLRKQLEAIEKLKNDIEQNKTTAEQKIASLEEHKKEAKANNSNKRKELLDRQALELEKKRNEYSSLMLEDASKFQSLQAQKD